MHALVHPADIQDRDGGQPPLPADVLAPSLDPVACNPASGWEKGQDALARLDFVVLDEHRICHTSGERFRLVA